MDGNRIRNQRIDNPGLESMKPIEFKDLRTGAAPRATHGATLTVASKGQIVQLDPDLATVIDAWPALPKAIRAGVVALVDTAIQSR